VCSENVYLLEDTYCLKG